MAQQIIDISRDIFTSKVYDGDLLPTLNRVKSISKDGYNLANASICLHNGTHIDAPLHFNDLGLGVSNLDLNVFYGTCQVIEENDPIPPCTRLLIKNKSSISLEEAKIIISLNIKLVGVESLSIGSKKVHSLLLNSLVIPLEGIVLKNVEKGEYLLSALPINFGKNADGSPVRAILIKNS